MLILALLDRQESYGYEIVTSLEEEGLEDIATGTVYPLLTRLQREGLLTYRLIASESGPARKYYSPTAAGLVHLKQSRAAWATLNVVVDRITAPTATPANSKGRES